MPTPESSDKELAALEQLVAILMEFDSKTRSRMIGYLMDRHNAAIADTKSE